MIHTIATCCEFHIENKRRCYCCFSDTTAKRHAPSSGTGVRAALVSTAAAVQHGRDASEQAEEHQLGDHPHRDGVVVTRHPTMGAAADDVGSFVDDREDREVWKEVEGGRRQRQADPAGE